MSFKVEGQLKKNIDGEENRICQANRPVGGVALHFFGNNTVAHRLCLSRLRDTGPAEQRSDMHLFVRCVFISTSSVSIHVSFFSLSPCDE